VDSAAPDSAGSTADSTGSADGVIQPRLGPLGYARFFWRQLTSMRTALLLLLLLALASVPGSLVPQRTSDPNGVIAFRQRDPDLFKILDSLGLFSTFSAPWFSAIYLLLFVSLIGCIVPRAKHHFDALRARPPTTPARLQRLPGFIYAPTGADAGLAIDKAAALLRRQGYRVERYSADSGSDSVSAERGYLRETGNLIFHAALVGMLLTVGVGSGFGYTGQRILVEGEPFTNVRASYDSLNAGRFFDDSALEPYSLRLDAFDGRYQLAPSTGLWNPTGFVADLSTRAPDGEWTPASLQVNSPLTVGGTEIYLLGNGFAPVVTVRDPEGAAVFSGPVTFLPIDSNLTSRGVVKVPDGLADQVALQGFFYPDPLPLDDGTYTSFSPVDRGQSLLTLFVYQGDLGLDAGVGVNAYTLNTDGMTQIAGRDADLPALELTAGETVDLPGGMGTVEFEGSRRFISVDIRHDPTPGWALLFATLIVGGLLLTLFVPRRRVWVKAVPDGAGARLEYAGLARGEDPSLTAAVADLSRRHRAMLRDPEPRGPEPRMDP